jgi:hypothetical protein
MASTKTVTVIHNDATLTAGAGDTTATAVDLADGFGALLHIKLTNGATGPTLAARCQVQLSPDNSNWYNFGGQLFGSTANNGVMSANIEIPIGAKYLRTVSGSNTGQNVTLRVEISEVTALS